MIISVIAEAIVRNGRDVEHGQNERKFRPLPNGAICVYILWTTCIYIGPTNHQLFAIVKLLSNFWVPPIILLLLWSLAGRRGKASHSGEHWKSRAAHLHTRTKATT